MWDRSRPAFMSRCLLASSKDRTTSMSRRHGPALRRLQLVISTIAPETLISHGPSGRSLWDRSRPAFMSKGLLAFLKDQATSMSCRHGPALRRRQLVITSFATRTPMSHGLSRRPLWRRSWSAFMPRGIRVSSKDRAGSMSRRHGPALRRPQLVICPIAPETWL